MEEENVLSVDHLGLKRFYFSSKGLLPSVPGQCCWRARRSTVRPRPLQRSRSQGKGAEERLRELRVRGPPTPQSPCLPFPAVGHPVRSGSRPLWPRPGRGGAVPGSAGVCASPALIGTVPVLLTLMWAGGRASCSAFTAEAGRAGPGDAGPLRAPRHHI